MTTTISNTSNDILGVSPSELAGYTIDEIAGLIQKAQAGLALSEPRMTEKEIFEAAKKIYADANAPMSEFEKAYARMNEFEFNEEDQDFIFSDWSNMNEHIQWLLTATRDEIAKWIKDGQD
jgi:CO dehydrogenase/acetyl-CoA synthase epsilon subunit